MISSSERITRSASAVVLAVSFMVAQASPAAATPPSPVRAAFGNTVLTVDPDGRSRKIWLRPDGTWTGLSRRGLDLAGKWTVKGDEVCLSQSKPRLPGRACDRFPKRVGDRVETTDPMGKPLRVMLVKGHVRDAPAR